VTVLLEYLNFHLFAKHYFKCYFNTKLYSHEIDDDDYDDNDQHEPL